MAQPAAPKKTLALLETRARHLLLMSGLGFGSVVGGSLIAAAFNQRIHERMLATDNAVVMLLGGIVLSGFWVMVVLPALLYISCRYLELQPRLTAVTAGVTGELFALAIPVASKGFDVVLADRVYLIVQIGTTVAGILIASWAGRQGRAWAERSEAESLERAKARKGQYDEFLKQAEAFADKREANPISGGGEVPPPPKGEGSGS